MRRSLRLAAVAAAIALAGAGCGGGGDDGGGEKTEKLSHEALVSRANAACRTAAAGIARIPTAGSIDELGAYADSVGAISTRLADELSRLTPSQPDETSYTRFLDALRSSNAQLRTLSAAAADGDRDAVASAARKIANAEPGTYAAVLGLDLCAAAASSPDS